MRGESASLPQSRATRPACAFTPRRGRPTADQAAAISNTIIAAASEAFLAEGYEGASMEAIAARAGVPKSTLYKRYPDKRELLRGVLRERLATWSGAAGDEVRGDDLEGRLKHYATTMLLRAMSPELRAVIGLVTSAWSGPDDAAARREVIGYDAMLERLAQEIRSFGPRQGIFARNPERVAAALMAMLTGWIQWEAPTHGDVDAEAVSFANAAVETMLRGGEAW